MAGVRHSWAVAVLLVAGGVPAVLAGCSPSEERMNDVQGRARAEALVASYGRHVGAGVRSLGPDNDVTFGESGFRYDEARNVLIGRAFVQREYVEDANPAELANLRRMVGFLNDPRVGGMYDRAGGTFVLDEPRNAYFLVREFPVDRTDAEALASGMDAMIAVAAPWVTEWMFEVAMVMHGKRPPPTARVHRAP